MEFIALDVETANPDPGSICQIGLVVFRDGQAIRRWTRHINPGCHFAETNISIHGIDETVVAGAPGLNVILPPLYKLLAERVVASHSVFDRTALNAAGTTLGMGPVSCRWLDVSRVARSVWPDVTGGYGLANLCALHGVAFSHHDALQDAEACGRIFMLAQQVSGLGAAAWHDRLAKAKPPSRGKSFHQTRALDGNPAGALRGEVVVFTGELTMPRAQAEELALNAGCAVKPSVTRATTIVVVGEQDLTLLKGHTKSSKHRKAEEMRAAGADIAIIGENEFKRLVAEAGAA